MVRVRLTRDSSHRPAPGKRPVRDDKEQPKSTASKPTPRGLTERQWVIGLLVAAGLLLIITFRGCVLPSGVGPKAKPSAQPSAAPSSAQPVAGEYTVEPGDTLSKIADEQGVAIEALAQANGINLNQRVILRVGQKLVIPARTP